MMRKFFFFAILSLALVCCVSCNHPVSSGFDFSGNNPVDRINGTITSDGTSITVSLPAFPSFSAARDAEDPDVNKNQHFVVKLQSAAVSENNWTLKGFAGETITFNDLTPGEYTLTCNAWDDVTRLQFVGEQNITVQTGSNEAVLEMKFVTEDEHIKLEPTEDGVKITIKGIDFDKSTDISIFEQSSGLRFTLDYTKRAEITANGNTAYTFTWPFGPSKVNGVKNNYYVFTYLSAGTENGVEEEVVCCGKNDTLSSIDLTNFRNINTKYEENGKQRNVFFENISLDTLRWTVTNAVSASKIEKFSALMELWAYTSDEKIEWLDTNVIDLPVSGKFTPGENDDFEQNCARLLSGNKVDFLDFAGVDAQTLNKKLTEAGKVMPNFHWRFFMKDIPNAWFGLPSICDVFDYTPVVEDEQPVRAVEITNGQTDNILLSDNGKPVLTVEVEQQNGNFLLTVNVPNHTTYMQIEESITGNSYHFTSKVKENGNDFLSCSGQKVIIPWAFCDKPGNYEFIIKYNANEFGYRVGSAKISSDSVTGADFEFNDINCKGAPQLGTDVVINSQNFTVKMPSGKTIADYTLAFKNTPPFIIQKTFVVYSLNFLNGTYDTYDLRFDLTNQIIAANLCSNSIDIKNNDGYGPLYFCNTDEYFDNGNENGYIFYGRSNNNTTVGVYDNQAGLWGNPAMYTTGGLAFRLLDRDNNYLDSGFSDKWYGEYRISLWSHEWEYDSEYPAPANQ